MHRDRVMLLEAPFTGDPEELMRTQHRSGSGAFGLGPPVLWCEDGDTALIFEYDWPSRSTRTWVLSVGRGPWEARRLWERSADDWYGDPGQPLTTTTHRGEVVVRRKGDHIYLAGQGGSPKGDRPFLDRFDLETGDATRLFQCSSASYEFVTLLMDEDAEHIVTCRETPSEPPNYWMVNTTDGSRQPITAFPHPQPKLRGITKQRIFYSREDGVPLAGDLYLPESHNPGERLPVLIWAYPREYADPEGAGQVRGSANRFISISGASHLLFLTQGYAVLDDAAMPIVGGLKANDTYVAQLTGNGEAAVNKLAEIGVADLGRIGIAGHSYGAFMTANMLAHTELFSAGIARSGAFNRSLTPFGFQFERRTFWDAPEVYNQMSAFMQADRITDPLLLIHGMIDNNPGTFPIQSERLYHALKGLGGTVRLVMLPNESHGYQARESVLHTVWEMFEWMNRHVRDREPGAVPVPQLDVTHERD